MMDEPAVKEKNLGLRLMAVSAVGLLLSLGLCGAAAAAHRFSDGLLAAGVYVLAASVVGLLVGVVMAVISGIRR